MCRLMTPNFKPKPSPVPFKGSTKKNGPPSIFLIKRPILFENPKYFIIPIFRPYYMFWQTIVLFECKFHILDQFYLKSRKNESTSGWVWDGAKCHTSASTLSYLDAKVNVYIPPENWPPNSCDLNPLDYFIWSRLESAVYRVKITSMEQLKERVEQCWCELPQSEINKAIDGFRKRLNAVVAASGGHIIKFKL